MVASEHALATMAGWLVEMRRELTDTREKLKAQDARIRELERSLFVKSLSKRPERETA
jgi:hypothetical protein